MENEDEEHYCDYCASERVEQEGQFCSKDCSVLYIIIQYELYIIHYI